MISHHTWHPLALPSTSGRSWTCNLSQATWARWKAVLRVWCRGKVSQTWPRLLHLRSTMEVNSKHFIMTEFKKKDVPTKAFLSFASNIDLACLNPRPSNCWFYTGCITYVVWAGAMGSITLNQKSWYYISFILFFWILNEAGDTFWPGKFKPLRSSVGNRGIRLLY